MSTARCIWAQTGTEWKRLIDEKGAFVVGSIAASYVSFAAWTVYNFHVITTQGQKQAAALREQQNLEAARSQAQEAARAIQHYENRYDNYIMGLRHTWMHEDNARPYLVRWIYGPKPKPQELLEYKAPTKPNPGQSSVHSYGSSSNCRDKVSTPSVEATSSPTSVENPR